MGDDYISKEQFYQVAHISKSTALRLIREGLVPAIDTGKATNRYLIAMRDVEFYLKDREIDPNKYGLVHGSRTQDYPEKYQRREAQKLSQYAKQLWQDEPDLLATEDVVRLLGYTRRTLLQWSRYGWITRLIGTDGHIHYPKHRLLKFMESRHFHSIRMKSKEHMELIRRISNEGLQNY